MATATRTTKSFSLDTAVLRELERTKGAASTSERVNQLLKKGLEIERQQSLDAEAAAFFSADSDDRAARRAFQQASVKSIGRE